MRDAGSRLDHHFRCDTVHLLKYLTCRPISLPSPSSLPSFSFSSFSSPLPSFFGGEVCASWHLLLLVLTHKLQRLRHLTGPPSNLYSTASQYSVDRYSPFDFASTFVLASILYIAAAQSLSFHHEVNIFRSFPRWRGCGSDSQWCVHGLGRGKLFCCLCFGTGRQHLRGGPHGHPGIRPC